MKAVMLMAYGTPKDLGDVEAYYTHIRGGRKPSPEELANLVERYKAIGGTSPLIRITEERAEQAAGKACGVWVEDEGVLCDEALSPVDSRRRKGSCRR